MWGKIFFAVIMLMGIVATLSTGMINMAIFFTIVLGVIIWAIGREKRGSIPRTR